MPEKFMKLFNLWGNPTAEIKESDPAKDEVFVSADCVENGRSREVVVDFMRPVRDHACFLMVRGLEDNEWILKSKDSSIFHMRAICYFESSGKFTSDFDPKFVYSNEVSGRVRIAIYLDHDSSKNTRMNPAVVMMSDEDRRRWKVLEVNCDACRYRRRRSSYTEGSDTEASTTSCPQDTNNSPCSYTHRNMDQIMSDFQDISSEVPSAQELLRINHLPMIVKTGAFTQIRVDTPPDGVKWCPLAGGPRVGALHDNNCHKERRYFTRIPAWSDKFKALALEFKNRQVLPSRRNYHLMSDNSNQSPLSYFYRTAKSEYVIEILPNSQLSIMQAFCIALTTSLWS